MSIGRSSMAGDKASQDLFKQWRNPKWKLMVFVSSTFTDTTEERTVILEKVLPKLKKIGIEHGIQIIFVDMRWGVKDENTVDHLTWVTCKKCGHPI